MDKEQALIEGVPLIVAKHEVKISLEEGIKEAEHFKYVVEIDNQREYEGVIKSYPSKNEEVKVVFLANMLEGMDKRIELIQAAEKTVKSFQESVKILIVDLTSWD